MTPEEKDEYQIIFTRMLMDLGGISDPITQGVQLYRKLSEIINAIYGKGQYAGRIEGFIEGYTEAQKQLEQELRKLN